jgi:TetR/AcrR family transcriptional regulator
MAANLAKRLSAAERRQSILDAALAVLAKEGYAGMTTARVARAVGVTEPILYRHFPSKRAILRTLLKEIITRMMTAFQELIEAEADPVAALRRICRGYPELSRRYQREFRIINQALMEANDPKTRRMLVDHYHAYRDFLQGLIEQGQRTGVLRRDIPAAIGAWHVIHSALGFLMTQPIRNEAQSPKDFESLADATLSGLLKSA